MRTWLTLLAPGRARLTLIALVPSVALAQPLPPEPPPLGRTRAGPVLPPEAPIGRTRAEPVLPQPKPDRPEVPAPSVEPQPEQEGAPPVPTEAPPPVEPLPSGDDRAESPAADGAAVPAEPTDGEVTPPPAARSEDAPTPPRQPEAGKDRGPGELGEAEAAACEAELDRLGGRFTPLDPVRDGGCGAARPLLVQGVGTIEFSAGATLRCPVAVATARWVREVVAPAAELHLDMEVAGLDVAASYTCRARRTGSPTSTLSEHAYANAIDISAVLLADGRRVAIMPREGSASPDRAFQAAIRGGACALFATVIGPTTNALHDDHLHLDLAERRGGGKLCE